MTMTKGVNKHQRKSAASAARRTFGTLFTVGEPIPCSTISGDDLFSCDPSAGLQKFLQGFERAFCPVLVNGQLMASFAMSRQDKTWKFHSVSYGSRTEDQVLLLQIAERSKNEGASDFRLVDLPSVNRQCLSFNTPDGDKLLCLRYWPSDPEEIRNNTNPAQLLAYFKQEWARKKQAYADNKGSSPLGGGA